MRWNYYKLRQLSLLQSAMDCYYKLRHLFYYKVRHGLLQIATVLQSAMDLLQIATGITKCDNYYKLRQYTPSDDYIVAVSIKCVLTYNARNTRSIIDKKPAVAVQEKKK